MYNKPKENREKALNKPFFLIFGASTPRSLANATFLVKIDTHVTIWLMHLLKL